MRQIGWLCPAACLALATGTVLAAGLEAGAPEPPATGRPVLLRVITYNLHHGAAADSRPTLHEMARFLGDCRPDLVALQEVDRNWSARSSFRDQAAELASAIGLELTFFATLTRGESAGYGLAILSRHPVAREVSGLYSEGREPRGYLAVEAVVEGRPLTLVVTHLGLDRMERAGQIRELAAAIDGLPGPLILAGDFNARPEDPAITALSGTLRDALAAVGRSAEGTLITPAGRADSRIDFVFATPEFRVEDASVPAIDYSDHRPVVAHLSLYLEMVPMAPAEEE